MVNPAYFIDEKKAQLELEVRLRKLWQAECFELCTKLAVQADVTQPRFGSFIFKLGKIFPLSVLRSHRGYEVDYFDDKNGNPVNQRILVGKVDWQTLIPDVISKIKIHHQNLSI